MTTIEHQADRPLPILHSSNNLNRAFYDSNLICHFDFLSRVIGVGEPILYGGALRDMDHQKTPNDYDFIGSLPDPERSFHGRVACVLGSLLPRLDGDDVTISLHESTQSMRLRFNHLGQKLDVGLHAVQAHSLEGMAEYGSLGLCAIAMNAEGHVLASERYIRDMRDKTITVFPDLNAHEYQRAQERALALLQRYPTFSIVDIGKSGTVLPTRRAIQCYL